MERIKRLIKYKMLLMTSPKKILIYIFILITTSCNQNKYPYSIEEVPESQFIITLDSITAPDSKMIQFFDNQQDTSSLILAMLNTENQTINIHNNKGNKVKEYVIKELDSLAPKITGFYFINTDSLLIYSYISRELKLVSTQNTFSPQTMLKLDNIASPNVSVVDIDVTSITPMLYHEGKIYITGRTMLDALITEKKQQDISIALMYDINTKRVEFLTYFDDIWRKRYWHNEQHYVHHTIVPDQKKILYSLAMKDSILEYDIKSQKNRRILMKSNYLGNEDKMIPKDIPDPTFSGTREDVIQYLEKPHYGEIIFDKYRNVYYRFISKGYKKRISYLNIYDNKYQKIGETKLPKEYFAGAGSFVTKDGLYLRKSELNHNHNESSIIFNLFKLNNITRENNNK